MEDERLLDTLSKSCYASKSYSFLRGEKASELGGQHKEGGLGGGLRSGVLHNLPIILIVLFSNQIHLSNA